MFLIMILVSVRMLRPCDGLLWSGDGSGDCSGVLSWRHLCQRFIADVCMYKPTPVICTVWTALTFLCPLCSVHKPATLSDHALLILPSWPPLHGTWDHPRSLEVNLLRTTLLTLLLTSLYKSSMFLARIDLCTNLPLFPVDTAICVLRPPSWCLSGMTEGNLCLAYEWSNIPPT